ncbi:MAG: YedE family putative selenium transporter [Lachnospiraceae bacterium]
MKKHVLVILTGVIIGLISLTLVALGNPGNMGFCIACFLRDTAGALGLQNAPVVQYVRPEIIGLVLGACVMAFVGKEFAPRGGSSPVTRFILGFCVMVGALMFLGCPLRMMIRIGGGDLNAIIGLVGFVAGIGVGILALNKGFSLKRTYQLSKSEGLAYPVFSVVLLVVLVAFPSLLIFSKEGPGSMKAPLVAALAAGLIVGALAQRSRFCTVAGIRDTFMFKDLHMLWGFVAVIVTIVIGNLIMGSFTLGFAAQPIAHIDGLWNFLGMLLVGFASVLLGGCPLRQLILAGEGSGDAVITVIGLTVGAAFCHNWGLASSGEGPTPNGKIATIICLVVVVVIAITNLRRTKKA